MQSACPPYFSAQNAAMLSDDRPTLDQVAIYRLMTPESRLKLAEWIYWTVRRLKAASVRSRHPDWPEEKVNAEVSRILLNSQT